MNVDLYERVWLWASAGLIALFLTAIFVPAALQAVHPPSHIETVDPTTIASHPEFGSPSVSVGADGRVRVSVVANMFAFAPDPIEVRANQPVTFRITSSDVIHGFQIVGTNANAMAIPGYVSQFSVTFTTPGDYLITCNEYCGILHHAMVGKVVVREAE
jgi:cytochrome c oxidase subunit 2